MLKSVESKLLEMKETKEKAAEEKVEKKIKIDEKSTNAVINVVVPPKQEQPKEEKKAEAKPEKPAETKPEKPAKLEV